MSTIEERIKKLKQKQVELRIKMRKELELDAHQSSRRNRDEDDKEDAEQSHFGKKRNDFDYTMRDFERWEASSSRNKIDQSTTDATDYDVTSKHTYEREIALLQRNIDISKERSDKPKASTETKIIKNSEDGIIVNDDKLKVQDLANTLTQLADKRYKKRSLEMMKRDDLYARSAQSNSAHVNEKNKQFNMKLDRELAKSRQ